MPLGTALLFSFVISACGGSGSSGDGAPSTFNYGHPGGTGGQTTGGTTSAGTSSPSGRLAKISDGLPGDDLTLGLATTSVTIRAGTFQNNYQALLTDLAGEITDSSSLKLLSLPIRLRITDSDAILERTDAARDIEITVAGVKPSSIYKAVILLVDYGEARESGATTPVKHFLRLSEMGAHATINADGNLVATFKVRSGDVGMVMATASNGNPIGYATYTAPPVDPDSVSAIPSEYPDKANVTWRAQKITGYGFSVAYGPAPVAPLCASAFNVTATETASAPTADADGNPLYEYTTELSGLLDNKSYAIRVCASDTKTPPTYSGPGKLTSVTTAQRAQAVLSATPNAITNSTTISVTVGGTGVIEYKYALTSQSTCDGLTYSSWMGVANLITASTPEGNHRLCVLARKSSQNVQLVPTEFSWRVDTTVPVIDSVPQITGSVTSASGINIALKQSNVLVHGSATISESGQIYYASALVAATCSAVTFPLTSGVLLKSGSFTADGTYMICVKAVDQAGNVGFGQSSAFAVDVTTPALTSMPLDNAAVDGYINGAEQLVASDITGTVAVSESPVTLTYALVASSLNCSTNTSYVASVPQAADLASRSEGAYKVCLKMLDALGNIGFGNSADVILDTVVPTATMSLINAASDGRVNASEHASNNSAMGSAPSGSQDLASSTYKLIPSATTCAGALAFDASIPAANSPDFTTDGAYSICMRLVDTAGNIAFASSGSITLDVVAPTLSAGALAYEAANGFINDSEKTGTGALISAATTSESSSITYALAASNATCSTVSGYGSAIPATDDSGLSSDGTYMVCVKMVDASGNIGYGSSSGFVRDTAFPSVASGFAWTGDAADLFINDSEKTGSTALLTAAVSSETATKTYSLVAAAGACDVSLTYSASLPTASHTDFSADGDYKACVKIEDPAGNISYIAAASIVTRDIVAPSATMSLINAASDGLINASEHVSNTNAMGAAPSGSADLASSTYKLIPSGTSCAGALAFGGAIPAADSSDFTTDGTYSVCMRIVDTAGNIAYASSGSITLDVVVPTLTAAALANEAVNGFINDSEKTGTGALISAATTSESSTITYALAASGATCGAVSGYGSSIPATNDGGLSSDGTYIVCVKMVDPAGNIGYGSSSNFIRDTAFPSVATGFAWADDAADLFLNDSEKTGSTALLTAAVSSETATKTYSVVAAAGACDVSLTYSASLPAASHAAFSADGNYKACVKMEDPAGNIAYVAASSNLTRDTVSPALSSGLALAGDSIDGYLNLAERSGTSSLVTGAVANETSTYRYVVVSSSASCSSATGYASGIPFGNNGGFTADGSYKVCVEITDLAGNKGYSGSSTIQLDTIAPTATTSLINAAVDTLISGSELASDARAMVSSATGSEALSASVYKLMLFSETCGASAVFASGIPGANSSDFGSDGNYKICMRVTDSAGNVGYSVSPTIALDTTAPTFSASIALANEASDGYINNTEKDAVNNLVTAVSSAGATATNYVVVANSATCSSASGYGSTIPKTNDAAMTSDGSWKVCVRLSDNAGNMAYSTSPVIVRDIVLPSLASGLGWTGSAWDNYLNATERAGTAAIITAAVASESSTYQYVIIASASPCSGATYASSSLPSADSADLTADGSYKACVEITDVAGNRAYAASSSNVVLDVVAPTATITFANAAATDGFISASEHASSSSAMGSAPSGSADLSTVTYKLIPTATTCAGALSFAGGIPAADSADFVSDGTYVICMRIIDNAGNVGYSSSSNITLDTGAPSLSSAALANDATDGYINSPESAGSSALISAATASESSTITYLVAASGATCAAQSGYSGTIPGSSDSGLTGDGSWKVCVKMTDVSGNIGYGSSSGFVRDTAFPSVGSGFAWTGDAADLFIKDSEKTGSTALLTAAVSSETATKTYSVVAAAGACDASLTYTSSLPTASHAAFTGDGDYKACVKMVDAAGNISYIPAASNVTRDIVAPSATMSLINAASDGLINASEHASNTSAMGATPSGSADLASSTYKLIPSATSCAGALVFGGSIPAANSSDFTTDGAYFICMRLVDTAGNISYTSSASLTLDVAAPTLTAAALANEAANGFINDSEKTGTGALISSATASESSTITYALAASSATCSTVSGYVSGIPATDDSGLSSDGTYMVCVKMVDASGNIGYGSSSTFMRDTAFPSVASGFAWTGDAADLFIKDSEKTGAIALLTAAVSSETSTKTYSVVAAAGACDASLTYTSLLPTASHAAFSTDGDYKACVKIVDTAGNISYIAAASNVTRDIVAPSATMSLINAASDGLINASERASNTSAMGAAPSGSADLASSTYKLIPSATSCAGALVFGGSIPAANSSDFTTDGTYSVCMRLVDTAGNIAYTSSASITLDVAAPTLTAAALANEAANGFINDSEKTGTGALISAATTSESSTITYALAASSATCSSVSGYVSGIPATDDSGLSSDGTYMVCVKMVDASGNIGYGSSSNIIRDTVSPTLGSGLALTGDGTDAYLNNAERSGTSALVTAAVANETSTYRYVVVSSAASCSAATGYTSAVPFGNNAGFAADGAYKICAELTDSAGNKGYSGSSTIQLDTIAPTATTSLINAASDSVISGSELASNALAMAAAATGSEALSASVYKLMLFSETCGASAVFAPGIPAANSSDFGSDGNYQICMRVTDSAGNVGYSVSPTIALDTTAPTFSASIALANEASDGYINNAEKDAVNDLISAVSSVGATATNYVVVANSATCSSASGYGSSVPKTNDDAMTSDGSWKVCVRLSDNAGNNTYSASPVIVRDIVSPSLASGLGWTGSAWDNYLNATERSGTAAIITAAVASESSTYQYVIIASASPCSGATYASSSLPSADSADLTTDGSYRACVEITDTAGNRAYAASSSNVFFDVVAPTATITFANAAATDGFISASEHASNSLAMGSAPSGSADLSTVTYKLIPTATTCGGALSFAGGIPAADSADFASDGTYVICMRIIDNAGNVGYSSSSNITLDTGAPSLSSAALANDATDGYINSPESAGSSALISAATASESSTITYLVAASGATCAAQSGYSGTIPGSNDSGFTGDGSWKVCVKMTDISGNIGYGSSSTFIRDTAFPSVASGFAWTGDAADLFIKDSEKTGSTALLTAAVSSETATKTYSVVAAPGACDGSLTYTSSLPTASHAAFSTDGDYKACVKIVDTAGNIAYVAASSNVTRDIVAPSATMGLINAASDGLINASERASNTSAMGAAPAGSADLASSTYKLIPSGTSCAGALVFGGSIPAANSSDFTTDGTYSVCMRIVDTAGNIAYASSGSITLDVAAPTLTAAALANEAANGFINDSEKTGTGALISAATTSESSTVTYALAASSATCSSISGYGLAIPATDDSGLSSDGTYMVCVKMVDASGNIGYGSSSNIIRDTVSPTLGSGLALTGDATDAYLNNAERSGTSALVTAAVANETSTYRYVVVSSAASCSAATGFASAVPFGNNAGFTADGAYKICAELTDSAGNKGYSGSSTIQLDTIAPTATTSLINAASDTVISGSELASNALAMAAAATGSEALSASVYKLMLFSETCGASAVFASGIPGANSSDFGSDGNYKICMRVTDSAGNVGYSVSPTIALDTTAPTFSASIALANEASDGYINNTEKDAVNDLISSVSSAGATATNYVVVANSATCSSASGYGSTIPKTNDAAMTSDGSWKVCVRLSDNAGNIAYSASPLIVRDVVSPVLSSGLALQVPAADAYLNSYDRISSYPLVSTATINESGSVEYTVSSGSCSSASGYGASAPTANANGITGDGLWKVCVKMTDSAGNIAYENSSEILVDTSGPSFTSLGLVNAASNGYVTSLETAASTDLASSLVASGYVTVDYKLVSASTTCGSPLVFGVMPKSDSSDFNGDGSYKVCARLVDSAGNMSFGATISFILDTALPSFTLLGLANTALDGYLNASDRSAVTGITGTLTASGHDAATYKVSLASGSCSSLTGWSMSPPLANDSGIGSDNTWKVCVQLADAAGNTTYGASDQFVVDTTAPALSSSLSLAGVADDGSVGSNEISNTAAVMASPILNESSTVTYILAISSNACSSGSGWNSAIPLASSFSSWPFNVDGTYKVCVRAEDVAGNAAYFSSPTITRDTSGPTFGSMALANAAADGYLNATDRTLATAVADTLDAEVAAAATYASVSSGTVCNSSLGYASSVQLANDGAFAADGTYKVCVRLMDAAGNVSFGASSTFIVDTVSASFNSVALANIAADTYLSSADRLSGLALVGDASSSGADVIYYSVITSAATCNATATFGGAGVKPPGDSPSITSDGVWKVCVKVTDNAGNTPGYGSSASFTVDTSSPSTTVTSSGTLSISSTSGSTTILEGAVSDSSPSAGISSVAVSFEDPIGSCLNNSKSAFNAPCPNWLNGSAGSSTWSFAVDDSMFLNGASYIVSVKATDLAGNEQNSVSTGSFSWSASEGSDLWNKNVTFNGSNSAQALASAVDSQGRLVVVGFDTNGATRGRVKRYTKHGVEDAAIDITIGDNSNNVVAYGVAIGGSDSIFVVGSRYNGSNNDWFVKKYSSGGVEDTSAWDKTYNGSRGDDDVAYSVGVATDGSVVVGGYSRRALASNSGDDWRIARFASDGSLACSQNVDVSGGLSDDRIRSLVIRSATSRIYGAGYSDSPGSSRGWAIGEFDLANCSLSNSTVISRGVSDEANSIAIDSTGQLIVAGKTSEFIGTSPDPWISIMNTSFASVCDIRPDVSAVSQALAVAVDSQDNIYVGGYKTAANENWWLRKFSSSCTEDTTNWNKVVNGAGNGNDRIQSISVSSGTNDTDNVYAVGWGYGAVSGSGNNDWWVKKYSGSP